MSATAEPEALAPFSGLDWPRLAEPQRDGYDTEVIRTLASRCPSPLRPRPWRRRPVDGAPTLFDGTVAVRNRPAGGLPSPPWAPAPCDHPNLAAPEAILRLWPDLAAQFPALVDTIQPWTDPRLARSGVHVPGSSSHSHEDEFGVLMVTVDSAFGLAQALVHEMAHHKLRALGVSLLRADRVVVNDPAALYRSPIITDRKRPMTAVLHAQYAFIHVTALDVAVHAAAPVGDPLRDQAVYLLARNVPRMEAGREVLREHLRTDEVGRAFAAAFDRWSGDVLQAGRSILDEAGYGMPPI